MIFPAITEKALAGVNGVATIECKTPSGPRTWLGSCEFTLVDKNLQSGKWVVPPTPSGATIKWKTTGNPQPGNEEGNVYLSFQGHKVKLYFYNPVLGSNSCRITHLGGGFNFGGYCDAGSGQNADFTYTFTCCFNEY
jgi:hypothetical protein